MYAGSKTDILLLCFWNLKLWKWRGLLHEKPDEFHPDVHTDLQRAQRIGLTHKDGWAPGYRNNIPIADVAELRKGLSVLKGVKEVLLGLDEAEVKDSLEPSQTSLEYSRPPFQKSANPAPSDIRACETAEEREDWLMGIWYIQMLFTAEEKERGIPDLNFVLVKLVRNVPAFKRKPNSKFGVPTRN